VEAFGCASSATGCQDSNVYAILVVWDPRSIATRNTNGVLADLVVCAVSIVSARRNALTHSRNAQSRIAQLIKSTLRVRGALKWDGGSCRSALCAITNLIQRALVVSVAPIPAASPQATGGSRSRTPVVVRRVVIERVLSSKSPSTGHTNLHRWVTNLSVATLIVCFTWFGLADTLSASLCDQALAIIVASIERASV